MKSRDASKLEEYVLIPEVDKDEVTAKKTAAIPSFGIIKKYKNKVSVRTIIPKWKSSWWSRNLNCFVKILNNK